MFLSFVLLSFVFLSFVFLFVKLASDSAQNELRQMNKKVQKNIHQQHLSFELNQNKPNLPLFCLPQKQ